MFFLFILIIIFLLALAVHTSKIGIEINNLKIDTELPKGHRVNKNSKIYVYLLLFNSFKILKKDIDLKNIKFRNRDIDVKFLKNKDFKIYYKELLKTVKIDIKKINLQMNLSTENAALTAILVGVISGALGIILKKPKYEVIPSYSNKNFIKIKLEGIFTICLMHYIYSIIFKKKRRDENERTSNRKSYDDCYE